MKKKLNFIGLISLIGLIGFIPGCAKKEEKKIVILPPQIPIEKPEMYLPEKYEYKSLNERDPFIALVVSEKKSSEGGKGPALSEINIFELEMTGIVWDKKESMAIFHDGNHFGYILKKGSLLADNFKPIKGIRGEIIGNNRAFLQQGKAAVNFFMGKPKITKIQGAEIFVQKEFEEMEELDKNKEFEEKVNLKKE
ncbi:MAG: hypothetical protein QME42_01030 [bacterium]|nr:hypothetical protein [bacterium]